MACKCLTYCLIFICLFVLSTLLFVSLCVSHHHTLKEAVRVIHSATLQSKVSQMVRDLLPIASHRPLSSAVPKRTALVAPCAPIQITVQVRCVTKFRTW